MNSVNKLVALAVIGRVLVLYGKACIVTVAVYVTLRILL